MKKQNKLSQLLMLMLILTIGFSCQEAEAPEEENEVEIFTDIELIFTAEDGTVVRALAEDPTGGLAVNSSFTVQPFTLKANTTYTLTFELLNRLVTPVEDVQEEILDEADEHQMFFEFTNNAFASPTGNGNIQDRNGAINYLDFDQNDLPLGLRTSWTTGGPLENGTFRVWLAHQPGVKTAFSSVNDGDVDFDITFSMTIEE
ncbi:hypothetical protein [Cecembia sp.]|uniref:hypothetical protein n=1 Tax=Cecembia sp. TaxID=1898110 RepID=UPI0025B994F0|nr:hypothetical protein [Cecembia sp.]